MRKTQPKQSYPGLEPALLTIENTCSYQANRSRSGVYADLKAGLYKSVVVGGRRLVVKASLDRYLASLINEDQDAA